MCTAGNQGEAKPRDACSPVQLTVDWQDGRVAQEGEGHGGDGIGALHRTGRRGSLVSHSSAYKVTQE